ncbi:MAG: elongation factor G [Ardenticatenaceae bacterium]|nr:elongation factor G [Ardenticatenaceae bacterium]
MKEYETSKIRNVAVVSHNGAGKTTLIERLLFQTGATTRMGSVIHGTSIMDFEEEEISRQSSISSSIAFFERNGVKVNLLDTPGYIDFVGEVNSALTVAEGALVLVEALSGVEVGTEVYWNEAVKRNMPRVLVINRMNRENVRVSRTMESIQENLDANFVPLQIPLGEGPEFKGVIDLLSMQCRVGEDDHREPIPPELEEAAQEAHMAVVEAAALGDDALMEKYFEEDNLSDEEIVQGLRKAMLAGEVVPIVYSAPEVGIAVLPVLGVLTRLMPSPDEMGEFTVTDLSGNEKSYSVSDDSPMTAFVFKTRDDQYGKTSFIRMYGGVLNSDTRVYDVKNQTEVRVGSLQLLRGKEQVQVNKLHAGDIGVVVKLGDVLTNDTLIESKGDWKLPPIKQPNPIVQVAVHPVSQSDVAKLSEVLTRLTEEDKTLRWYSERATKETILAGMGMTHLDIAVKKAKSKFGLNITTTTPKVPYRETITGEARAEYTHKKQSGGAGQYARVMLRLETLNDDDEFEFSSEIFGGAISGPFVTATEKGCRAVLESGPMAGYPVTGVKAIVYDGKEHPVDSKEIAFQTAGRECFKKAMMQAGPTLLEPIYTVTVTVPEASMGDILGDMNTRRARVQGMENVGNKSIIKVEVPLAEVLTYSADLRSMTGGRGVYGMEFSHYGRVPNHLQDQIKANAQKEAEEA